MRHSTGSFDAIAALALLAGCVPPPKALPQQDLQLPIRTASALRGMTDKRVGRGEAGETTYRTLLAAGMHFQDRFNYDVERVKRCVIHDSTPEGMIPFCAYNSGPVHRERVEREHAIPLAEWKARQRPRAGPA